MQKVRPVPEMFNNPSTSNLLIKEVIYSQNIEHICGINHRKLFIAIHIRQ